MDRVVLEAIKWPAAFLCGTGAAAVLSGLLALSDPDTPWTKETYFGVVGLALLATVATRVLLHWREKNTKKHDGDSE